MYIIYSDELVCRLDWLIAIYTVACYRPRNHLQRGTHRILLIYNIIAVSVAGQKMNLAVYVIYHYVHVGCIYIYRVRAKARDDCGAAAANNGNKTCKQKQYIYIYYTVCTWYITTTVVGGRSKHRETEPFGSSRSTPGPKLNTGCADLHCVSGSSTFCKIKNDKSIIWYWAPTRTCSVGPIIFLKK